MNEHPTKIVIDATEAAANRERGWWRDATLYDDVAATTARHPDKVAIVGHHHASGGVGPAADVLSYRHLLAKVDRFAAALVELGVRPGEVVSFQLPNWWHVAALHLACVRIGAVANPILTILRHREVGFILERVQSRVFIVPGTFRGFDHAALAHELRSTVPTLDHVFVVDHPTDLALPDGLHRFETHFCDTPWEQSYPPSSLDTLRPSADAAAQIIFTSGTTGEPKGVLHTHNTLDLGLRCVSEPLGLTGDDVVLMFSPLGHQTGYLLGMCMPLRYGMKFVLQDLWEPEVMLRLVADEGVTWTMGATTFVLDACAAVDHTGGRVDLPTFRFFSCGGAPIPPRAVQLARDKLGAQLVAVWGMTEIGIATTTLPSDIEGAKAMTSDGVGADWVQLRIADSAGSPLPSGTEGRLLVRTPTQHRTYFGRHDLYEASFQHGWFDTGDLARLDDEGYIRITGRSKDIIIRGGENIPVTAVEAALYRCPKVREVAVIGYPDDRLGERTCAVVVPAEGETIALDDLTRHLQSERMAKQYWPERIELRDALPKTASGKIQKFVLRHDVARSVTQSPVEPDAPNCSPRSSWCIEGAAEHRAAEQAVVSVGARYLAPSGRVWEVHSLRPHDRVELTTPGPDGDGGAVVDVEAVARMIPLPSKLDGATLTAEQSPGSAPSQVGARPEFSPEVAGVEPDDTPDDSHRAILLPPRLPGDIRPVPSAPSGASESHVR